MIYTGQHYDERMSNFFQTTLICIAIKNIRKRSYENKILLAVEAQAFDRKSLALNMFRVILSMVVMEKKKKDVVLTVVRKK